MYILGYFEPSPHGEPASRVRVYRSGILGLTILAPPRGWPHARSKAKGAPTKSRPTQGQRAVPSAK